VIIGSEAGIAERPAAGNDHVRLLGEEKGRILGVVAQLLGMGGVIPAHAPDPPHGKAFGASLNSDERLGKRKDKIAHAASNCWNSEITAFTAASTMRRPASALACDGSEPMRPSGKRRRKSSASRMGPVGAMRGDIATLFTASG